MSLIKNNSSSIKGEWLSLDKIISFPEFKSLVDNLVKKTKIPQRFKPRLYSYSDFIIVKLASLILGYSVSYISEKLNAVAFSRLPNKKKLFIKIFIDRLCRGRLISYQTDMDKFFRRLTESEV